MARSSKPRKDVGNAPDDSRTPSNMSMLVPGAVVILACVLAGFLFSTSNTSSPAVAQPEPMSATCDPSIPFGGGAVEASHYNLNTVPLDADDVKETSKSEDARFEWITSYDGLLALPEAVRMQTKMKLQMAVVLLRMEGLNPNPELDLNQL